MLDHVAGYKVHLSGYKVQLSGYKVHLSGYKVHHNGEVILIARQVVLIRQLAKFCWVIRSTLSGDMVHPVELLQPPW